MPARPAASLRRSPLPHVPLPGGAASPLLSSSPSSVTSSSSLAGVRMARDRSQPAPLGARARFEKLVRRYYYQLVFGCQDPACTYRLCASCPACVRLTPQAAAVMAVQLAARPRHFFCPRIPAEPNISLSDVPISLPVRTATPPSSPSASPRLSGRVAAALTGGYSSPAPSTAAARPTPTRAAMSQPGATDQDRREDDVAAPDQSSTSPAPQPPPKPFLYSLLSSSAFSSLFRSTEAETQQPAKEGLFLSPEASPPVPLAKTHSAYSLLQSQAGTPAAGNQPAELPEFSESLPEPVTADQLPSSSYLSLKALGRIGSDILGRAAGRSAQPKPPSPPNQTFASSTLPAPPFPFPPLPPEARRGFTPSVGSMFGRIFSNSLSSLASSSHIAFLSVPPGTDPGSPSLTLDDAAPSDSEDAALDGLVDTPLLSTRSGRSQAIDIKGKRHEAWESPLSSPAISVGLLIEDEDCGATHLTLTLLKKHLGTTTPPVRFGYSPGYLFKDQASLLGVVRNIFSSSRALNRSFLVDPPPPPNSSDLGVDIPSVREAYSLLLNTEPKELIARTLANALEILLASLDLNTKNLYSGKPYYLRQLIIAMESPLLEDSKYRESIVKNLCLILGRLPKKCQKILIGWFASYDTSGFLRLVGVFQTYISEHYAIGVKPDEALQCAVYSLRLLHDANEFNHAYQRVPISSFYNDSLNKKVNFKEEYRNWKRSDHSTARGSTTLNQTAEFSLFDYPFLFDPVSKSRVMHIDAMVQMSQEFEEAVVHQAIVIHAQRFLQDSPSILNLEQELKGATNPFLVLEVRRQHLVRDVLDQVRRKKDRDLKKPLKIKFVAGGEEGMDQGGVQKEFFQVLAAALFDPAYGMFVYEEETRACWFNAASLEPERQFELVGTVIGLALYNGVILGITFPRLMYKKLLDEEVSFEDLKQAFPTLGRGLQQLLDWEDGDVSDIFMRSFEISYEVYGQVRNFPLLPDGENLPVTNENRAEYVDLYTKHLVGVAVERQFRAFQRGFQRVCGGRTLKMCRAEELELLLCGTADLDFGELERGADYDDSYHEDHPFIRSFWSIVHDLTHDQKKKLLTFVTASDRVPLKGLGNLTFVVQRNGPDTDRLPTALTCFGRLLLPEYATKEKLRERLVTAIENAKGFGLV
ncbi:hypothetical protein HK405_005796 [Cladochytrium tenue]|nr:hypothetical protein HK405_005796 [Cladochytrium tenue]